MRSVPRRVAGLSHLGATGREDASPVWVNGVTLRRND